MDTKLDEQLDRRVTAAEADAALMDGHTTDRVRMYLAHLAAEADAALMDGHRTERMTPLAMRRPRRPTRP